MLMANSCYFILHDDNYEGDNCYEWHVAASLLYIAEIHNELTQLNTESVLV